MNRLFCFDRFVQGWIALFTFLSCSQIANANERFAFFHEHILGTSLEIQIDATNRDAANAAETRILNEIARLSQIFSGYDANSEFSRWQTQAGTAVPVSNELFDVLAASEQWRERSDGAFNPAVETLTQLWRRSEKQNCLPQTTELAAAVAKVQKNPWVLDPQSHTATRTSDAPLSLNAIAKGAILDLTCKAGMETSDSVFGVLVCIGGDLRAKGDMVQPIHIVDPQNDAENVAPIATIYLHDRGLATSGNYRRGFRVANEWYSHIIDPRSGKPASKIASATVVADETTSADVLATIMSVLDPADSRKLAESIPGVDYMLIDTEGHRFTSPTWSELEEPQLFRRAKVDQLAQVDAAAAKTEINAASKGQSPAVLLELLVTFELDQPTGSQYRRPYVAIWLEDADEFPIRTAVLWMQTKQPGPRWHRDLLRWYRQDGVRKLADKRDLIGTVSGATRGAGQYKAVFDGKDDAGVPLAPGKYTLFIEVAREHGTYQLIRQPLTLGTEPIAETKLKKNAEIKSATYEYRAAASDKQPAGN